jgi:glycosyltransferase involved in cell wall biosynthesis
MVFDFTVAIPTYNGAERLPQLLDRLRSQINPDSITWEIIIVDNNSADQTAHVITTLQATWVEPFPLRYVFEPEQGAAFARQRAMREAQSDLVGFLDDDNLPACNWLVAAYTFAQANPKVGAFSGQIHGEFEVEPPECFQQIQQFLAIREHGPTARPFRPELLQLPPAASLVVRRQVWLDHVPPRPALSGKLPGLMVQGDDYEPLLYIYRAGWEIWYTPTLETYHQIPHWRLERSYLLAIAHASGLATCQLRLITAQPQQKPVVIIKTILGNLRRVGLHVLKYRATLKTDLIASFELAFFLGSLWSPFYVLRKRLYSNSYLVPGGGVKHR